MGSGWTESLAFFQNRVVIQRPNQMDCATREYYRVGHWRIKENLLQITWFAEANLEGGSMDNAHGSCGGEKELVNARPRASRLQMTATVAIPIKNPRLIEGLGQLETSIAGQKYYQSRKDPKDY